MRKALLITERVCIQHLVLTLTVTHHILCFTACCTELSNKDELVMNEQQTVKRCRWPDSRRSTFRIDPSKLKQLKVSLIHEGRTMQDWFNEVVDKKISEVNTVA